MGDSGPGFPGWFVALFVIVIIVGIATAVWRISVTRKMAQDAGLDPNTATKVALLSENGIDATYLASTLASHSRVQPPPVQPPPKSAEERLQELQGLRDRGLVTPDEYEAQRKQILNSI